MTSWARRHRVLVAVGVGMGALAMAAGPAVVTGAPATAPPPPLPLVPLPELQLADLTRTPAWLGLSPVAPWRPLARRIAARSDADPERVAAAVELIWQEARRYGGDPYLDAVVVLLESDFNAAAISPAGARGLYQLMPDTAADIAATLGAGEVTPERLHDPAFNIRLGAYHLHDLHRRYGDWARVLTAYNFGEGGMQRHLRTSGSAESIYSRRVLELWEELRAGGSGVRSLLLN